MAMTNVFTGSNGTLTLADEDTPEGKDLLTYKYIPAALRGDDRMSDHA